MDSSQNWDARSEESAKGQMVPRAIRALFSLKFSGLRAQGPLHGGQQCCCRPREDIRDTTFLSGSDRIILIIDVYLLAGYNDTLYSLQAGKKFKPKRMLKGELEVRPRSPGETRFSFDHA